LAADILHHGVAGHLAALRVWMLDEIVDLDNVGVVHLDEESSFGHRRGQRIHVAGIDQAL
jgi:hypothetical protein